MLSFRPMFVMAVTLALLLGQTRAPGFIKDPVLLEQVRPYLQPNTKSYDPARAAKLCEERALQETNLYWKMHFFYAAGYICMIAHEPGFRSRHPLNARASIYFNAVVTNQATVSNAQRYLSPDYVQAKTALVSTPEDFMASFSFFAWIINEISQARTMTNRVLYPPNATDAQKMGVNRQLAEVFDTAYFYCAEAMETSARLMKLSNPEAKRLAETLNAGKIPGGGSVARYLERYLVPSYKYEVPTPLGLSANELRDLDNLILPSEKKAWLLQKLNIVTNLLTELEQDGGSIVIRRRVVNAWADKYSESLRASPFSNEVRQYKK